jgi:hypothetical protein
LEIENAANQEDICRWHPTTRQLVRSPF